MSLPVGQIVRAHHALGTTLQGLGDILGVSRRTAQRIVLGQSGLGSAGSTRLVEAVYAKDPALARELASIAGLKIEEPAPPPPPPPLPAPAPPPPPPPLAPDLIADSVACAAADVADVAPAAVRPLLLAAFSRAARLGVSLEQVIVALGGAGLAPAPVDPPPRKTLPKKKGS